MTTLTYWLKTYWYAPLIIIIGGFFFWQQAQGSSASQPMAENVRASGSSQVMMSRSSGSASSRSRPSQGFVHLKGAVLRPGIYPVRENTRWDEVIKAAGGLTANADMQQINLAKIASDQESLHVPEKGETVAAPAATATSSVASTGDAKTKGGSGGAVDLNKADATQLQTISGIGPKKAADIINYRDSHGGFKEIAELKEVPGIGDKTFETLAPQFTLGP
ncbi:transporter [Lacticaseibacillus chiayiensis]|uniref:Helix-hairpin-helix domain-containing protein n=1 Tax=Lacticaseibacillus chiayiensis TaxID=2100821 RepID=A0A4Q1UDY9_9LACO|nr:helix-hairpin-helix domain-containing protein [Lacticaseibacillus chiayiensis]QVI35797.1 helix-hairpin-helix domain-containing protein [Lacticaseibacillus chiayiensis]RXT30286.1 transporter [Lacticaseibacillus chiayiensis]UYN57634.1 helix-hairpin-helix domain-containing protein [Lacticaseibacillus chiayiensis]